MTRWELLCVHRESGEESRITVLAEDEKAAFAEAARRGLVVAKVVFRSHVPEISTEQVDEVLETKPNVKLIGGVFSDASYATPPAMIATGRVLMGCGFALVVYGFVMDTTAGNDVHNIGLLNRQVICVIAGSGCFVAGTLLRCTGQVIQTIQNPAKAKSSGD